MLPCAAAGVMNEVCWWLRNVDQCQSLLQSGRCTTLGVCQQEEDGHLWTVDTQVTGAECVLDKLSSNQLVVFTQSSVMKLDNLMTRYSGPNPGQQGHHQMQ